MPETDLIAEEAIGDLASIDNFLRLLEKNIGTTPVWQPGDGQEKVDEWMAWSISRRFFNSFKQRVKDGDDVIIRFYHAFDLRKFCETWRDRILLMIYRRVMPHGLIHVNFEHEDLIYDCGRAAGGCVVYQASEYPYPPSAYIRLPLTIRPNLDAWAKELRMRMLPSILFRFRLWPARFGVPVTCVTSVCQALGLPLDARTPYDLLRSLVTWKLNHGRPIQKAEDQCPAPASDTGGDTADPRGAAQA